MTIRNIPDQTHRALKARAKRNGRSTEAEIRQILEDAVHPGKHWVHEVIELAGGAWGPDLDEAIREIRDEPPEAAIFE